MHPRPRQARDTCGTKVGENVLAVPPVSYLEMLALERHARKILTDSGGVQKEALWMGVPCVTLRDETEWVETVECGWNTLVGTDEGRILAAIAAPKPDGGPPMPYGDGRAAERIVQVMRGA